MSDEMSNYSHPCPFIRTITATEYIKIDKYYEKGSISSRGWWKDSCSVDEWPAKLKKLQEEGYEQIVATRVKEEEIYNTEKKR